MEGLNINKELREVAEAVIIGWGDELIGQGHKLSGKLIKSLEYKIKKRSGEWSLEFFVESYGLILDRGVKKERIPYTPGRKRANRSKFIEALIRFVKRRLRIGGRKGVGIAFAIAKTMKKEGMPTKRSFRYSRNGRRTGWIDNGFDRNLKELDLLLEKIVGKKVELFMDSIFEEGVKRAA